jgi:hypothetical protein
VQCADQGEEDMGYKSKPSLRSASFCGMDSVGLYLNVQLSYVSRITFELVSWAFFSLDDYTCLGSLLQADSKNLAHELELLMAYLKCRFNAN